MPARPGTFVSVDLDDLACYHAIHGLAPLPPRHAGVGLLHWLPRFLELFGELGVRATFFVIGRDLRRDLDEGGQGADVLRRALAEGHELGNHSFAHAYDLVRWSPDRQRDDLLACDAQLRELGATVQGFRAPGYTHDAGLLRTVAELGYRYDSSCLPSPTYYAAKLAIMGMMRLRGKQSSSSWRGARSFLRSPRPHRLADASLWELPMSVSPVLRLPLIGTSLLASPEPLHGMLMRAAVSLSHFNFEMHGIDLADADRDPIAPALRERQPELRVPLRVRRKRLRELLVRRGGGAPLRDAL